jgi:four helix bundle protein
MQDFRRLKVWRKAHALVLGVYAESARFPEEERFGLRLQMRRSAMSIAANVAEGAGRGSDQDFARFLTLAFGSASELDYHLLLAHDLRLLAKAPKDDLAARVEEVKRMLAALRAELLRESRIQASPIA